MSKKPAQSRLDTAVPKPEGAAQLNEREKQAMELGEEAEHSHGPERERLLQEAKKAGGGDTH